MSRQAVITLVNSRGFYFPVQIEIILAKVLLIMYTMQSRPIHMVMLTVDSHSEHVDALIPGFLQVQTSLLSCSMRFTSISE
jgi:spore germination protein GerM